MNDTFESVCVDRHPRRGCYSDTDGSGTQNQIFQEPGISQQNCLRQVEQGFSSFFVKLLAYLKIFQSFNLH